MDLEIGEIKCSWARRIRRQDDRKLADPAGTGVIMLAIKRRDAHALQSLARMTHRAGDYLIAMGEPAGLRQVEQMAASEHS